MSHRTSLARRVLAGAALLASFSSFAHAQARPIAVRWLGHAAFEVVSSGGTRILIDKLLGDRRPPGYGVQTKSHNAVAAAVQQSRADWGVAISTVAEPYGLSFLPLQAEQYDFVIPRARAGRAAVDAFRDVLHDPATRERLRAIGFDVSR